MLSQAVMRAIARKNAYEQIIGWLEDRVESDDVAGDRQTFLEALEMMEADANELAQRGSDEAAYYAEQAKTFYEAQSWPLG